MTEQDIEQAITAAFKKVRPWDAHQAGLGNKAPAETARKGTNPKG